MLFYVMGVGAGKRLVIKLNMDIDTDMDFFFLTKLAFIRLFLDLAPTVTAKT